MVRLKDITIGQPDAENKGFNSKMVRLKVVGQILGYELNKCFNSKMVRLKEDSNVAKESKSFSFNSKMVRLKAC